MEVNIVDGIVVGFCGAGLLLSIWLGQGDLAQTIAVGLIGYIGGSAARSKNNNNNNDGEE